MNIEFSFTNEADSVSFRRWYEEHQDANTDQILAHAKAHGAIKATLGDGTEWELNN
jgi:hypothetical protein